MQLRARCVRRSTFAYIEWDGGGGRGCVCFVLSYVITMDEAGCGERKGGDVQSCTIDP